MSNTTKDSGNDHTCNRNRILEVSHMYNDDNGDVKFKKVPEAFCDHPSHYSPWITSVIEADTDN